MELGSNERHFKILATLFVVLAFGFWWMVSRWNNVLDRQNQLVDMTNKLNEQMEAKDKARSRRLPVR